MKKTNLLWIGLAILSFAFVACSNDDSPPGEVGPTALTLSIDKSVLFENSGESFNFTTIGDDSKDYSTTADYYIDGVISKGNSYAAAGNSGRHAVYAMVGDIKSNTEQINIIGANYQFDGITLIPSKMKPTINFDVVSFKTEGKMQDGEVVDISNLVTIYVNDAPITGTAYTFSAIGSYSVAAKIGTQSSTPLTLTAVDFDGITVTASTTKPIANLEIVSFKTEGKMQEGGTADVSNIATIYVNDTPITGSTYTFSAGSYSVKAKVGTQFSAPLTLTTVKGYPHRVLIEDFTGAWCGWCPRVLIGIDKVHETTEKVVVAAIHRGNPVGSAQSVDPWNLADGATLEKKLGVGGYPTAKLSRTATWASGNEDNSPAQPINMLKAAAKQGFAISSTLSATSGTIQVSIDFIEGVPSAKYVVYVLEDGLVYDQTNYYTGGSRASYYGGKNPIKDFTHKDVVRKVATTSILGDAIPADKCVDGGTFVQSLNVSYTSENVANLKIMAILLDASDKVLNVRVVPANQTADFE